MASVSGSVQPNMHRPALPERWSVHHPFVVVWRMAFIILGATILARSWQEAAVSSDTAPREDVRLPVVEFFPKVIFRRMLEWRSDGFDDAGLVFVFPVAFVTPTGKAFIIREPRDLGACIL